MNREIIFRGLSTETKKWVYGYYSDENGIKTDFPAIEPLKGTDNIHISWKIDKNTLGQYTGLNDKNGRKIFEGDIVKNILILKNNTFVPNIDVVEFNQEDCSFMLGKNKRHFNKNLDLEVIGNIYEDNLESEVD